MLMAQQVKTRYCKIAALYLVLLTHSTVRSSSLEADGPLDNKYSTHYLQNQKIHSQEQITDLYPKLI
jgi:hypothetical protein